LTPKEREMDTAIADAWGIVLAGGEGSRLSRLTRYIAGDQRPKQFCRVTGGRTLLGQTLARIAPLVAPERTVVVGCAFRSKVNTQIGPT